MEKQEVRWIQLHFDAFFYWIKHNKWLLVIRKHISSHENHFLNKTHWQIHTNLTEIGHLEWSFRIGQYGMKWYGRMRATFDRYGRMLHLPQCINDTLMFMQQPQLSTHARRRTSENHRSCRIVRMNCLWISRGTLVLVN